jgi:hypothetical protein
MLARTFDGIAKTAIGMILLIMLSAAYSGDARCQTPVPPAFDSKELHGGIEIALRAVRAVALRVSVDADGDNIPSMQWSDQIIVSTPFPQDGNLTPEYISNLAEKVQQLFEKLQRDYHVPRNQIYLLGLSEIEPQFRDQLARTLNERIGRGITFLNPRGETELNIASHIPRRYQFEGKSYENRGISLLIDINGADIRGGYQQLTMARGKPDYDYVTWNIPIKSQLRLEAAQIPGLMMRKKVYLMGNIVWALAALLYPADRQPYLPLTLEDINTFYYRALADPEALLNPDLSRIRDENARNEAREGREAVKAIYTPKSLTAAAEVLKLTVIGLNLSDKKLIYARNGSLTRLLSFVRVQIE